jgi:hypothetical protein
MSNLLREFDINFLTAGFEIFAIISISFIWGSKDPVDLLLVLNLKVPFGYG